MLLGKYRRFVRDGLFVLYLTLQGYLSHYLSLVDVYGGVPLFIRGEPAWFESPTVDIPGRRWLSHYLQAVDLPG
uniref:Uncharacterized protein n=1 Tax=Arion vulgaris TaxID=1028688 RepID=A0A0B6YSH9_9EUPU